MPPARKTYPDSPSKTSRKAQEKWGKFAKKWTRLQKTPEFRCFQGGGLAAGAVVKADCGRIGTSFEGCSPRVSCDALKCHSGQK